MKKKLIFNHDRRCYVLSRLIRVMKLTTFFLLITFISVNASVYSQITKLDLKVQNATVKEVLNQIEDQSNFFFMYNDRKVDVQRKVDLDFNQANIEVILKTIFKDTHTEFVIKDRQIVLYNEGDEMVSVADPLPIPQQRGVSGKVTDSSGATLPGVSVVIKGTTIGTITDVNGHYSLSNVSGDAILVFSFVGMKSQEISVSGKTSIDVIMAEEAIGLDEVVAIGYGTVKKSDLTGAVASVKLKDANLNANVNAMQALQGTVPGLNIGAVSSAGGSPDLYIRGYTSLSTSHAPLVVVDGVIFSGSISDLSTNDIERIDVLKDASAAAVYGSRSANGVILITTKKGISEKPVFNFNTYHGFQQMSHKIQMADGEQYIQKILDYRSANKLESNISNIENYLSSSEVENYRNKNYTDWVDLLTRTAPISQYDLSVSGKSNKTNYYLSGSYTDQEGVLVGDNFNRATLRANFSNDITNWLSIGMNTMFAHDDYSGNSVAFDYFALASSPLGTVYDENGKLKLYPHNDLLFPNPLTNAKDVKDEDLRDNLSVILFTDVKIPKIKGLKFHFDYSNNMRFSKHNQFWDSNTVKGYESPNGYASKDYSENRSWSINNILTYNKEINKHVFDATLVSTCEKSKAEGASLSSKNFPITVLGWNAMELGKIQTNSSSASDQSSIGIMGRLVYSYDMKYLLTATFRRDGFSGFAEGNKYANFPSVSIGWVMSNENFAKSLNWLSNLKIRLSYGINGNQALGSYGSLSQISTNNYVYGDGSGTSVGLYTNSLANKTLAWERTETYDLGLDFSVLKNKISGEIDVYKGATTDQLVKRSLPAMSGYSSTWTNLGEINNKGIEFALNTKNISTPDFSWNSKFSFSLNRNKIARLYGVDANKDGKEDDDIGNSWFVGKSMGAIYDYAIDGIYQIGDDVPTGWVTGKFRLKDIDGKEGITPDDRSVVGYSIPNYRFGIINELTYKNISLSFMINSIQGGGKENYYVANNSLMHQQYFADRGNIPAGYHYWTENNPTNKFSSLYYGGQLYSPGYYENRSFVRLQDVTLAYTFTPKILNRWSINGVKVYLSGKNLYTWTNFTGLDPEAGSNLGSGYPVMRTIICGLNINF